MSNLTREQVKVIVIEALSKVADLPEDVEAATFDQMVPMHRRTFLENLKRLLNAAPFEESPGTAFYDVDLEMETIDLWKTVGVCIDWVFANQMIVFI